MRRTYVSFDLVTDYINAQIVLITKMDMNFLSIKEITSYSLLDVTQAMPLFGYVGFGHLFLPNSQDLSHYI